MYRWFVLMDVSNCTQHFHQRNPDSKQFESESDDRLEWLATTFLDYLEDMKRHCLAKQFITKEIHAALIKYFLKLPRVQEGVLKRPYGPYRKQLRGWERRLLNYGTAAPPTARSSARLDGWLVPHSPPIGGLGKYVGGVRLQPVPNCRKKAHLDKYGIQRFLATSRRRFGWMKGKFPRH
ncbi:hypothetical protein HPB49_005618 [Dermacentor silvarum]|uniref:Uncharacterized protein n=1 Tax=Dermacentor silvarum TaxID=543639 RepID=A0ACB8CDM9_DERSI|nr:hypothetical protein HPB49_005618 [Dermacentor silvarum]